MTLLETMSPNSGRPRCIPNAKDGNSGVEEIRLGGFRLSLLERRWISLVIASGLGLNLLMEIVHDISRSLSFSWGEGAKSHHSTKRESSQPLT